MNFQMFKLDLEKAEEPEIKLLISVGSLKKQESFRKTYTSALLTVPKYFVCVGHNKLWKILKEMEIPDHQICLLRACMQVRRQQLEQDMEQQQQQDNRLVTNRKKSTWRLYIVTLLK